MPFSLISPFSLQSTAVKHFHVQSAALMLDCICPLVLVDFQLSHSVSQSSARTNQDSHLMPQSMLLEFV